MQVATEIFKREKSMFETREWKRFFDQAASTETDAESQLYYIIMGAVAFLPGILKDIHTLDFKSSQDCQSEYAVRRADILERTERTYRAFKDGHICYQCRPPYPVSLCDLPVAAESPGRVRCRGAYFSSMIFFCRIRATFGWTRSDRAASEAEAQSLAACSLQVASHARSRDPILAWHLEERSGMPRSAIRTREQWGSAPEYETETEEELAGFLLRRLQMWLASWSDEYLAVEYS